MELLLLIEQLLQAIREDYIRVVEPAVLLVELVVLVLALITARLFGRGLHHCGRRQLVD